MNKNEFVWLLIFSVILIVWTLCYKYIWIFIPAKTVGAVILAEIFYAIALSFIASFVFYLINIHIPERRRKKEKNEKIAFIVKSNLIRIEHVLDKIKSQIHLIGWTDDCECIEDEINNVNFNEPAPGEQIYSQYYWISFFSECRKDIELICYNMIDLYNNDLDKQLLAELNDFPAKCALSLQFNISPTLKDNKDDILNLLESFKVLKEKFENKYGKLFDSNI